MANENENTGLKLINLGDTVTTVIDKANKAISQANTNTDAIEDLAVDAGKVNKIILDQKATINDSGAYEPNNTTDTNQPNYKAITLPVYTIKQVDDKVAEAGKVDGIVLKANDTVVETAGTLDTTTKVVSLPVYTAKQVDDLIKTNVGNLAGGMRYIGTLNGGTSETPTLLPTLNKNSTSYDEGLEIGDTYKVAVAGVFKYIKLPYEGALTGATEKTVEAEVGDLLIYNSKESWNPVWEVVPSGDDGDVYAEADFGTEYNYIIVSANDETDGKKVKASGSKLITEKSDYDAGNYKSGDIPSIFITQEIATAPATTTSNGAMSAEDKKKLEGIEYGANNYTLPTATTSALGGVKSGGDISVTADGKVTVTTVGGKTADEIGKVKNVFVNGETALGNDGIARITIDDLMSDYVAISANAAEWESYELDGVFYNAIRVAKTDINLEVFVDNKQVITQTVYVDDEDLYILVNKEYTTLPNNGRVDCVLRKAKGGNVNVTQINGGGGGTVADTTLYCHTLHIHGSVEPDRLAEGIISIEYNGYATFISKRADIFSENTLVDHLSMMDATSPPIGNEFNVKLYPANGFALVTAYIKDQETGEFTIETEQYQKAVPCGIYAGRNVAICWFGGDDEIEITDDMDTIVEIV